MSLNDDQPTTGASSVTSETTSNAAVGHSGHSSGGHGSSDSRDMADGAGHEHAPYAYSLVSWGSVFAGAVVAVALGAMLNIAGVAVGVTAADAGANDGEGLTAGAGLWLALSTVLGMLAGGYVAARSAHNPDHHEGLLHGAAVWAVGFLLAFFLTGSMVSSAAFNGAQAAAQASEAAGPGVLDRITDAARTAGDAATPDSPREREAADTAGDVAKAGAWWAFITMLTSLVAACIGGTFGARHDEKMHRPRRRVSSDVF